MKTMARSVILGFIVVLAAACASAPTAEPTAALPTVSPAACVLRLATTTSTADSGLLDYLLPAFESAYHSQVDVIAVGTGQALEIGSKGDADVVLVHARQSEDQFVQDGHAAMRWDVMYNDYIIVGPAADPAQIAGVKSGKEAFKRIADKGATFASRGDKSGTHIKELSIWSSAGITPTVEMIWYNALGQGMGETLLFSNEHQSYTLTDRGTYLAMRDKLHDLTILVGGETLVQNTDKDLLNPYGVMVVDPNRYPGVRYEMAVNFVNWLLSLETQTKIGAFGADKYGQPLFYPSVQLLQ